jgi:hypothetical protein
LEHNDWALNGVQQLAGVNDVTFAGANDNPWLARFLLTTL